MKSRIDNLGDMAGTSTFRERPEDINTEGREKGTQDTATLIQMAIKARGRKEEARYRVIQEIVSIALNPKEKTADKLKALKELIDRLEGPIKQDIGIETTQPLLVFKSGQEEDVKKVGDL